MSTDQPSAAWTWQPSWPIDLVAILSTLRRGATDPSFHIADSAIWWATRCEEEPTTLQLRVRGNERAVHARAWGSRADQLVDELPQILGANDDPTGFEPRHDLIAQAWRRFSGWRVPATGRIFESLAPAILEQKVTGGEARRSWRSLVSGFGDRSPGPTPVPMWAPPTTKQWSVIPEWEWYRFGVTPQRRSTLVGAARYGNRFERLASVSAADAGVALQTFPGIGRWTAAEVRQRVFGDPDTVSAGDFHLAQQVIWGLTGERVPRGDDDRMFELLEPYRGHRYRVQRLLELSGVSAPRRGARFSPTARLAVMQSRH